jgi:hypothetical protein
MSQLNFVHKLSQLRRDDIQKIVRATIPRTQRAGFTSTVLRNKATLIEECDKLSLDSPTRRSLIAAIDTHTRAVQNEAFLTVERIRAQISHSIPLRFQCYSPDIFMSIPNEDEVSRLSYSSKIILFMCAKSLDIKRRWYAATNSDSLKEGICGVCGRRLNIIISELDRMPISSIPNRQRLLASMPKEGQLLFDGMILEPDAIYMEGQTHFTQLCIDCRKSLNSNRSVPPPLSLANGLWIGQIPIELSRLSFPESLLISHFYPRVFICKLWPKDFKGAQPNQLQSGLVGNVTSFDLNLQSAVKMLAGDFMPRRPEIFSLVLAITIVSKMPPHKSWLKNTFKVRREFVRVALLWLKINNPKYYGHVEISEEVLESLPENDVPSQILDRVHLETDESCLNAENDSYVPADVAADHVEEPNELLRKLFSNYFFVSDL